MVYLLQSIAWSLPILFISKFPGLLLHCMIGAQAAVTDLAEPGERAKAMGRLSLRYAPLFVFARRRLRGVGFVPAILKVDFQTYIVHWFSYGIGMVVGSTLGGVIAESFGHYFVALLAAVLSAATLPLSVALMNGGSHKAQTTSVEV